MGSVYSREREGPTGPYVRWVMQVSEGGRGDRRITRRVFQTRQEAADALSAYEATHPRIRRKRPPRRHAPTNFPKTCRRCGVAKAPSEFNAHPRNRDGLQSRCRECVIDRLREVRETPEGEARYRDHTRARDNRRRARLRGVARESYRPSDIFKRDAWRCHLCGLAVKRDARPPDPMAPTIDHLIPLADNGPDTPTNVATAHARCNSRRGKRGTVQLRLLDVA